MQSKAPRPLLPSPLLKPPSFWPSILCMLLASCPTALLENLDRSVNWPSGHGHMLQEGLCPLSTRWCGCGCYHDQITLSLLESHSPRDAFQSKVKFLAHPSLQCLRPWEVEGMVPKRGSSALVFDFANSIRDISVVLLDSSKRCPLTEIIQIINIRKFLFSHMKISLC